MMFLLVGVNDIRQVADIVLKVYAFSPDASSYFLRFTHHKVILGL
jgi:hypothetical protein